MYSLDEYEVYVYPNKLEFNQWEKLERWLKGRLRDDEYVNTVMAYLHNYYIINVDPRIKSVDVALGDRSLSNPLEGVFG
jgi:hypothetical protein